MSFQYKKVLVLGATSGIGEALAAKFVQEGAKVIVTGRRKENLDAFVQQHGEQATAVQFDITQLDQIPSFAQESVLPRACRFCDSKGIDRLTHPEASPRTIRIWTASC